MKNYDKNKESSSKVFRHKYFLWKDNVAKITCRYLSELEINLTLVKAS